MIKEFSVENWILGGTCFILIFTLGCFLWFQHQMAYLQPVDTDQGVEIQHLEKPSKAGQIELTNSKQPEAPKENSFDSKDVSDVTSNNITSTRQENIESAAAKGMPS